MSGPRFEIKTMKLGKNKTKVLVPIGPKMSDEEFLKKVDKILTKIVQRMEANKGS